jgi:hypothetical protein
MSDINNPKPGKRYKFDRTVFQNYFLMGDQDVPWVVIDTLCNGDILFIIENRQEIRASKVLTNRGLIGWVFCWSSLKEV